VIFTSKPTDLPLKMKGVRGNEVRVRERERENGRPAA
jgi:hypothetical protein